MTVDRSTTDNIADFDTGFLRYRAGVFDSGAMPSTWIKPNSSPTYQKYWIITNVYSARNLMSGDENGLCDPEAVVYHMGMMGKTTVVRDSLDPNWSQRLVFESVSVDGYLYPLVVSVYDLDSGALKDNYEFLGYSLVNIDNLLPNGLSPPDKINNIPSPDWYQLSNPVSGNQGKICLSVQISTRFDMTVYPFTKMNTVRDIFKLKLYILGLRNLKPGGLFEVKNPQIRISMSSVKEGSSGNFSDVLTCKPRRGGPDANYNNLIS